jgi:flavorubredoxin
MYCVRKVTDDLWWVGGNDRRLTRFENIHPIPKGISYNSYLLLDQQTVLFDSADWSVGRQFLDNLKHVLQGRSLDYLVIQHMEPDHAGCIEEILLRWPDVRILTTPKGVLFMHQFGFPVNARVEEVKEGDTRSFGKHKVTFFYAPMVHWPEVMVTYDSTNGVLYSADAFGSFTALNGILFNDEVNIERDWIDEIRRYYTNIVGKYGTQVQQLLKKLSKLDLQYICPLHGPVWRSNIPYLIDKYDKWSRYEPEEKGVLIVYASMYGNTETAAESIAAALAERGYTNFSMYDVSSTHVSYLISETFKYSHIVLASVTYNLGIYLPMLNYLQDMKALNLQKRTVSLVENGSWAIKSGDLMTQFLSGMRDMTVLDNRLTVTSSLRADREPDLDAFMQKLLESLK